MTTMAISTPRAGGMTSEQRLVIFASSLGTVFEWYDFYIYGTLGAFLAKYFFSNVPPNVGFIFALLAFAAGFAVRPFGALIFGHFGDLIGRKYTFLVTMGLMGIGTFFIGVIPGFATWGITGADPADCVAPDSGPRARRRIWRRGDLRRRACAARTSAASTRRGFKPRRRSACSWRFFIILGIRTSMGEAAFGDWGWRIPFLLSAILLAVSLWIRLKLNESPLFTRMVEEGKSSKRPLSGSFRAMEQRQDCDPGFARRDRRRSRGVVWRPVLRAVLSDTDAKGSGRHRADHDCDRADHRHALLHPVRLAVRQDRAEADHARGLCAGGRDLLPDLPGHHSLRQSEAGSCAGGGAGHGDSRSVHVLVPVQGDRHGEVHHALRRHQGDAGRSVGELQ